MLGRSSICLKSNVLDSSEVSVATASGLAATCTACCIWPSVKLESTRVIPPAFTTTPDVTLRWKPCFSIDTRYVPGTRKFPALPPAAELWVDVTAPVASLVAETRAWGTPPPLASRTVPSMRPVLICALTKLARQTHARARKKLLVRPVREKPDIERCDIELLPEPIIRKYHMFGEAVKESRGKKGGIGNSGRWVCAWLR